MQEYTDFLEFKIIFLIVIFILVCIAEWVYNRRK